MQVLLSTFVNITTYFQPVTICDKFYNSYLYNLYSNHESNAERFLMKNLIVGSFFMIFVAGCASTEDVSNWQGESLSALIEKYGTPDSFLKLNDGSKVLEYDKATSRHLAGNFCSVTFMVDNQNKILGASRQGNGQNCN